MMTREEAVKKLTAPGQPFEVVDATVSGLRMKVFKATPPNMRAVFEATRQHGDKHFLVYEDTRYTFQDHYRLVSNIATVLRDKFGVKKGDRVGIAMRNYPEWVFSFWACQCIGAVAVTLNAWWTGAELEYAILDSGLEVLLCDGERVERLRDYLPNLPLRMIVTRPIGNLPEGAIAFDDVIASASAVKPIPDVEIDADDNSTILYTSGTTGQPKGAVGTHRNHCTNLMNSLLAAAVGAEIATSTGNPPPALPPQPVTLQTFPYFHIGGLTGLYVTTAIGSKVVLMYKWDAAQAVELIEREGVSSLAGVPTVVRQALETARELGRPLPSLASIASGGAPVPPDLINKIGDQFEARVAPGNGYGLTETTSAVITNGGDEYFKHPDSVGKPVPVCDVRIVDINGNDCKTDEVGELWMYGPNIVRGYWNKPEATAEAFTDGWFHSGDLARRSNDGYVYVVDRLKDVVIRGGENVYCAEVEAAIFDHPAVEDVAVIGLPHEKLGEEVAAVINLKSGTFATQADIQTHVASRLARFKVPTIVVFAREPLPRTATGKVLKRELRDTIDTAPVR